MKCPNCEVEATDEDYNNGVEKISFWVADGNIWCCECFDCNCEWKQKGTDGKPYDIKKET